VDDAAVGFIAAIAEHSAGLADAAEGNLDAVVQHCPGWAVADLVHHLTTTHWFWATIVEEHLSAPPAESRRPSRASRGDLIATCRANADRLVGTLRSADGTDPVYTWAPGQQDIAFITRHQVQEAAVHHWDAVDAIDRDLVIAAPVAVDAIEEFLTFSVSSQTDPADPLRPALAGQFALRCSDTSQAWTIFDDTVPGTIAYEQGIRGDIPEIVASSSDLLLWLYQRLDFATDAASSDLVRRFRALCYTD
jgi:uncharacterized protein (TIGR03083 family)